MSQTTAVAQEGASNISSRKKLPKETFRKDYKPPLYWITHVELDFSLGWEETQVTAVLTVKRDIKTAHGDDLVLDGEELSLKEVKLDGRVLQLGAAAEAHVNSDEKLVICGKLLPVQADTKFKVQTIVTIQPSKNLQLMGLFKSGNVLCTQCEAEGFRRITYALDRPDVMAAFRVRLSGDKTTFPVLLSNGNQVDAGMTADPNVHYAVYEDPHLKPVYLFALVAGELASLADEYQHPAKPKGKKVKLHIWSEAEHLSKLHWSMESIKRAMQWDEDTFGLEYDLDLFNIVCIRDFNMGAMENKSLNVFVSSLLLASQATSTDSDYLRILGVVGHEYFHNWTGDRVTCRDWFQLTLKEGLTVFRDQMFSADMGSASVQRIEDVLTLRACQFGEDCGPMAHPIRPESYIAMDNFYTATVYQKGAEVIRMYHTILGKSGFRKGMDLYFKRHDGQAVTCDDFRAAMQDANDHDFTQFERWYLQSGTPTLTITDVVYNASAKTFKFKAAQQTAPNAGQQVKLPFDIPILCGLIGKESKSEVKPSVVFRLTEAEQVFTFHDVGEDCILSVLRNFSAPVKLVYERSDGDLAFLMAYDTDDVNRWDSSQTLTQRVLLHRAEQITKGHVDAAASPLPSTILQAYRSLLTQEGLDAAFKAFALLLPVEGVVANDMRPCDPVAIHQAREAVKKLIVADLGDEMHRIYKELTSSLKNRAYAILPAETNTAPRQLRNLLLGYLTCTQTDEAIALAYEHFKAADNMTDKLSALRCLANYRCPERESALQKFYDDAKGDDLVIDKWFAVQSGSDLGDVLDRVKDLMKHERFSLKTPSRMRCLISRFAVNTAHYHHEDGRGYRFIAEAVKEVDTFNGPIAARLCSQLIDWNIYGEARQKLMRSQLEMLITCNLRPETYEIVKRGLGDI
eukprot:Lankesteria_metandrocarpae@DN987_c0_g1_i1.p1